ncbi:PTS system, cellobiose-specific IIC component [Enterococcus sp. AZ135]|uniref:PTS sugar transporter subunit IIC n=1 Tax=unclassified Enterococcus TaxID=2608891 RepID=UPI003F20208B
MGAFMGAIEEKLMPIMNKVSNQRHLSAIRDGLIITIPLTIIGAVCLLIPTFPWPKAYVDFMGSNAGIVNVFMVVYQMTLGMLSVYVCIGIGTNLAKIYKLDQTNGALSALLTFLSTMIFSAFDEGTFLSTAYLGGEGMFTAIIASLLAVEVMHFCKKKNISIKMPDSVPANISASFELLIPIIVSSLGISSIVHGLGFNINNLISSIVTPILSASSNSILSPLVFVSLTAIMWFFGIHPAVLGAIMTPIWTVNATANMEAVIAGASIPNLGVQPFVFTFLWIGGGGGTLALCLLMCFSKSSALKSLGRLGIVPSFFNINEPILFGLPIVLNPILIVPFFLGPIICTVITYVAFKTGIVAGIGYPFAAAWNFPSFISAPIATASITGLLLVIVNFLIYLAIYYPFFKIYEKKQLEIETGENV